MIAPGAPVVGRMRDEDHASLPALSDRSTTGGDASSTIKSEIWVDVREGTDGFGRRSRVAPLIGHQTDDLAGDFTTGADRVNRRHRLTPPPHVISTTLHADRPAKPMPVHSPNQRDHLCMPSDREDGQYIASTRRALTLWPTKRRQTKAVARTRHRRKALVRSVPEGRRDHEADRRDEEVPERGRG